MGREGGRCCRQSVAYTNLREGKRLTMVHGSNGRHSDDRTAYVSHTFGASSEGLPCRGVSIMSLGRGWWLSVGDWLPATSGEGNCSLIDGFGGSIVISTPVILNGGSIFIIWVLFNKLNTRDECDFVEGAERQRATETAGRRAPARGYCPYGGGSTGV